MYSLTASSYGLKLSIGCGLILSSVFLYYYVYPQFATHDFTSERTISSPSTARREKFLTRDWSVAIGFNNMRYIIEANLLYAQLLDRTLILPSFLYARSCEYGVRCSTDFKEVNFKEAALNNRLVLVPEKEEEGRGWMIPIEQMIDMDHLQKNYEGRFILVPEYLKLYSDPSVVERLDGQWNTTSYPTSHTYHNVPQKTFLPLLSLLVDTLEPTYSPLEDRVAQTIVPIEFNTALILATMEIHFGKNMKKLRRRKNPMSFAKFIQNLPETMKLEIKRQVAELDETDETGSNPGILVGEAMMGYVDGAHAEEEIVRRWVEILREREGSKEWILLRTFTTQHAHHRVKPTQKIDLYLAYPSYCTSFVSSYDSITSDILHIQGETHEYTRAASLWFTGAKNQASLAKIILVDLQMEKKARDFADILAKRMSDICGGRQFLAAHMRRGDFLVFKAWVADRDFANHLDIIILQLSSGLAFLQRGYSLSLTHQYLPGGPSISSYSTPLPLADDPFYISTDEVDPVLLGVVRTQGGLLLSDLMTAEDDANLGPAALVSDWRGLVEQRLLSKGAFFFGSKLSSFTGGVMNQRVNEGKGWGTSVTA